MDEAKSFPLLFTFPELITGKGFVARVEVHGRALMVNEGDGDIWIFGVQPGGIAGGGKDYSEACREFKKSYLTVLFDVAAEAPSYDEFVAQVNAFFADVNGPNRDAWDAALAAVRSGSVALPGFGVVRAETRPVKINVALLEQPMMRPELNQFDKVEIADAA
jgi:hypothetical protein